ncbi:hypothetical protein GIB67_042411, partial [Kingdonia uniflora]
HTPLGVILSVLLAAAIKYSSIKEIFVTTHSVLCILVLDHVHTKKPRSWIMIYLRLLMVSKSKIIYGICKSFLNSFIDLLDH